MKTFSMLLMAELIALAACVSCRSSQALPEYSERAADTESLFELFYGMERDSAGRYFDDTLDSIPGLRHEEFCAEWHNRKDSISFDMEIGLYIDRDFPSLAAKRIILEKVDSLLAMGMDFDLPEGRVSLKQTGQPLPDSVPNFIKLWSWHFERLTNGVNSAAGSVSFPKIVSSRGCVICHRIYEDPRWATYILEFSYDYHNTCGCPSSADYVTIDKTTGQILSKTDILSLPGIENMKRRLALRYLDAARANGFNNNAFSGDVLLEKADGVALVNEGLLFYFHPYNIGCGAEGQYNLIIPAP